ELPGIGAVTGEARTMRKQLYDALGGDVSVQAADIFSDGVIELQSALLAQLQCAGGGERLGMGGDPKAVARRELLAGVDIGKTERVFGNDLAAMTDRDDDAGLLQ